MQGSTTISESKISRAAGCLFCCVYIFGKKIDKIRNGVCTTTRVETAMHSIVNHLHVNHCHTPSPHHTMHTYTHMINPYPSEAYMEGQHNHFVKICLSVFVYTCLFTKSKWSYVMVRFENVHEYMIYPWPSKHAQASQLRQLGGHAMWSC